MSSLLRIALEEEATGKLNQENEHVIYARVTDFAFLKNATSSEVQEQWEVRVPKTDRNVGKGSIRIRKTSWRGIRRSAEYVLTTKVVNGEGKSEIGIPTTFDNFEQFKQLSEQGLIKERYFFPIEGTSLVFEVDMFFKGSNDDVTEYHDWCKIDLEVPTLATPVPELPFPTDQVIDRSKGTLTSEEEALITRLYDEVFLTRNNAA